MKQSNRVHYIGFNPYAANVQPKQKSSILLIGIIIALLTQFKIGE